MEKIITVLLNSEEDAFKASQEIGQLSKDGDITLRELYILNKDEKGEIVLKNAKNEKMPYTATGFLAGGFIGLLGGPLGILFGMTTGMIAGGVGDMIRSSRSSRFLEKATSSIPFGKTAIVANIDEYWEVPLNTVIEPYGVKIQRLNINAEIDKFIADEQKEISEEIDELKYKLKTATDEQKIKINTRLEELSIKKQELKKEINQKTDNVKSSWSKWLEKAKTNVSNWKADIFDHFDDTKEDLLDDYQDLKEDYRELSAKVRSSAKKLNNATEETFKKSVEYVKYEVTELDEDIQELGQKISKLADKDKERWQAKLDKLTVMRNDLVVKIKTEFEAHKQKYQNWLINTNFDFEKKN